MNRNRTLCKTFRSFADDYFDPQEPTDLGFCLNEKSPLYYNEGAGFDEICDFYDPIKKVDSETIGEGAGR